MLSQRPQLRLALPALLLAWACAFAACAHDKLESAAGSASLDDGAEFDAPEPLDSVADAGTCAVAGDSCQQAGCCALLLCSHAAAEHPAPVCQAPTSAPLLRAGIHPRASDAMRLAGLTDGRIIQTIGDSPESAGTHLQDGTVDGAPYSAATDIDVANLDEHQIRVLLDRLGRLGFAAWYRQPGYDGWPADELAHVHAVYAACEMKTLLRLQIASWLSGGNGMVSNAPYGFYTWPATAIAAVQQSFAASGSGTHN